VTFPDAAITHPGIYDLTEQEYHSDPVPGGSLSSTGARKLLPPGCPAKFKYWLTHPDPPSRELDFGSAAHRLILGAGADIKEIDAMDYKKKDAQEAKREAYAAGQIPVLPDQMDRIQEMATAILDHPLAAKVFDPRSGKAEQTIVWQEEIQWRPHPKADFEYTTVWRRALLDFLTRLRMADGRLIVPDYKTCKSAERTAFMKSAADFGYHQQGPWYIDAVRAAGLAEEVCYLLVAQEKDPPYLVNVIELDETNSLMWGRDLNDHALRIYAECTATNTWPGYPPEITLGHLPKYAQYAAEEILSE
jgi:hypothetical protein